MKIGRKIKDIIASALVLLGVLLLKAGLDQLEPRVGAKAAELILKEKYGYMVAMINGETTKVPLSEVAGKLKTVDPNCSLIKEARMVGISFGDE